jgi:hypothetical protein
MNFWNSAENYIILCGITFHYSCSDLNVVVFMCAYVDLSVSFLVVLTDFFVWFFINNYAEVNWSIKILVYFFKCL